MARGPGPLTGTLTHFALSEEGQRDRHRGHGAFLDQAVGISTSGASSISTCPLDVSMATWTVMPVVSTLTFPGGK